MRGICQVIGAALLVLVLSSSLRAQAQPRPAFQGASQPQRPALPAEAPQPAAPPPQSVRPLMPLMPLIPLRVQVVISKYDNGGSSARRISSLPYELAVTANDPRPVNLRMGSQVPVPAGRDGAFTYLNVGTTIDAIANTTDDGRFKVELTIEDSSIIDRRSPDSQPTTVPTLRSFHANNSLVLRDGQSSQFTAATDKTSGEVTRVEVMLVVEK